MTFISIMADERSGSTFAGSYAAYHNKGIFYAGELDNGLKRMAKGINGRCSCGEKYLDCSVWGKIMPEVQSGADLKEITSKLQEVTGAQVIVDSSKDLSYHRKFREMFGDDHYTMHIKRNPKGVILSRMKSRKRRILKGNHPRPHIANKYNSMMFYDIFLWSYRNAWMESFKRPEKNLDLTYDLLDKELPNKLDLFLKDKGIPTGGVDVGKHIVMGNKFTRMRDAGKDIVVSHSWKKDLKLFQRTVVDFGTFPTRYWYKYNFRLHPEREVAA